MDKLENNEEYNKDIDYFDLNDELDQEGNPLPEKIELSEDLINGDKDAKRIVESLYKSLDFVYGIYKPQYVPKWLKCLEISLPIIFLLTSIFLIISTFALKVERSLLPTMLIPALVCIFFSAFTTYLFILKNKTQQVWWYKDSRKTVAIYKPTRKTENGDIVIYVNKNYQYRYYNKEQVWKKNKLQCMDARLLFKHLNGKLRIENYSNGNIEIYT
ncbi:MAG: hypothetical protein K2O95_07840, partial [Clostridia bacterium]|nr:hypothetical protein [Clostridia bacterium]